MTVNVWSFETGYGSIAEVKPTGEELLLSGHSKASVNTHL